MPWPPLKLLLPTGSSIPREGSPAEPVLWLPATNYVEFTVPVWRRGERLFPDPVQPIRGFS